MYIQKFNCPFCDNESFNLPKQCYVCNQVIPQDLVGKMAFVTTLQQSLKKFKEDGFVDDDLFENIMALCNDRHSLIAQKMASFIKEQTTESESEEDRQSLSLQDSSSEQEEKLSEIEVNSEKVEEMVSASADISEKSLVVTADENLEVQAKQEKIIEEVVKETESFTEETILNKKVETEQTSKIIQNITAESAALQIEQDAKAKIKQEELNSAESIFSKKEDAKQKPKMANIAALISGKSESKVENVVDKPQVIEKKLEAKKVFDEESFFPEEDNNPEVSLDNNVPEVKITAAQVFSTIQPERPSFASYLGHPAIKENILLFIGIFLIMAGEVFVVSNSWSGFSSNLQFLSIYALVLSSSLIFSFIGYFTAKRLNIKVGGSILFFISMILMPLTFIAPTNLPTYLMLLVAGVTLILYSFIAHKISCFFSRALSPIVFTYFIPLCIAHVLLPSIKIHSLFWYLSCYGTAMFTILGVMQIMKMRTKEPEINISVLLMWTGILGIAWAEFVLHLHYIFAIQNYKFTIAQYTPILAILGLIFSHLDGKTSERDKPFSTLNVLGISSIVLAITVSVGNPNMILATTFIGMLFFGQSAARYRRYYFFQATLLLSLVAYFFSPLILGEYVAYLRNSIINFFGYNNQQTPYALYSISFLPYMVGLCFLSYFLKKTEPGFLKILRIWFVMTAVGTWSLLQFGSTNLEAQLILLPIYAICYLSAVSILEIPFLYYLSFGTLSVWAFDMFGWLGLSLEGRMSAFMVIAVFWYICSLRKSMKESLRKALIDTSFLSALTVPIMGIFAFSFPPGITYSSIALISSLWLLLSVFVYQARWLWYPCYALVWFSIFLMFYHYTPLYFTQALLRASVVWSYGAVLITIFVQYLEQKNIGNVLLRPGIQKQQNSLHEPLFLLVALPILFVVGSAIEMWQTTGLEKIYLLWAVSFLPLIMPKILRPNVSYSYLALFPFMVSIVYTCVNPSFSLIWIACAGSILFSVFAILLRQHATTIFGLTGILCVFHLLFTHYGLAIDVQALIFVLWGILWWGLKFAVYKYWQEKNDFLSFYSMFSVAIGYCLCNYFLWQNPTWGIASFASLFLCSAYIFLFAMYWQTSSLVYFSAIVLNQAFLCVYHSFYAFSFSSFAPAEATICCIFFAITLLLRKIKALELVKVFDNFTVTAIFSTIAFMGIWRFLLIPGHDVPVLALPSLTYGFVAIVLSILLFLFCNRLQNAFLFYAILGNVWLASIFFCDYYQASFVYYLFTTVALSFAYSIFPVVIPSMRTEKQYVSLATIFSHWSILLCVLSLAGSIHQYEDISSVCVVLFVALNFLVINFIHPQWKSTSIYYFVFVLGLSMLAAYLYRLKDINSYIEQIPIWGSILCAIFCFISWRATSWRTEFYCELSRYVSWITLLVAIALVYLTTSPIANTHMLILLFCICCQAFILAYVGQKEVFRVSHYLMLFLFLGFYALLRLRSEYLSFCNGHDELVIIGLFTIVPSVIGCFLHNKQNREVVSNFSVICLTGLFLNYLYAGKPIYEASTYLIVFALILTMRDSYQSAKSQPEEGKVSSENPLIVLSGLVAMLFSGHAFFIEKVVSVNFFAGNAALIGLCSFVYFALYQYEIALWFSFAFLTMAGYFLEIYQTVPIHWQPMYLLSIANILLLLGLAKYKFNWGRFAIESKSVKNVSVYFATSILYIVILAGGICYFEILFHLNDKIFIPIVTNNMYAIFMVGIATIATALHTMYYNQKTADLPLYAIFILVGLTAPIGHIISNTPWNVYSAANIECAILGSIFWLWAHKYNNRNCYILSAACLVIALFLNDYNIHQPVTFCTLFLTSIHFFCCFLTQKENYAKRIFHHLYTINLLLAVYFLCFYLLPKTGKPAPLVFPLLAIITSIISFVCSQATKVFAKKYTTEEDDFYTQNALQTNVFFTTIAMIFLAAAVILIEQGTARVPLHSYHTHLTLCIISIILLIIESLSLARRTEKPIFYYQFQGLLIATFFLLRYRMPWFHFLSGYEAHALVIFSITFFQIGNTYNSKKEIALPFLYASYTIPFMALCYLPFEFETIGSSLLFLCAVHFGLVYIIRQNRLALCASLGLLNLGIYQLWHKMSIVDPQFYGIPLGITLIIFAELNRREMHEEKISSLHKLGLLLIYGSSAVQLFLQFHNPAYAVVLGVICFVGIIVGTFLKNNIYISTAALFLVLDILSYVVKFGMDRGILPGMLLVLAGTAIIGSYIYTKRKQQE